MQNAIDFLKGKKTYLIATVAGVVYVLELLGYVSAGTANSLFTFLGIGGVFTIRAGINNAVANAVAKLQ